MPVQLLNPDGLYKPANYSHVAVPTGRLVYVAGQVAYDENGTLLGGDNLGAQARQAFRNLVTALAAVGGTPADIVKLTTFVVNHEPGKLAIVSKARQEVLGDVMPASTYLGVQALARPDLLVEVEAIAAVHALPEPVIARA